MIRNKFNMSRTIIGTGNVGELIPIGWFIANPGDTIQHSITCMIRSSPLLSPPMHPVVARVHTYRIPIRTLWSAGDTNFQNFITGGPDGEDNSTPPTITPNTGAGWAIGSLADYLEVPTGVDDLPHSALPFRAYAAVWNNNYRDKDLQTALTIDLTDGADTTTNTTLQNICWEKDRTTAARLDPQKGTAVTINLGGQADVDLRATTVTAPLMRRRDNHNPLVSNPITTDAAGVTLVAGIEAVIDPRDSLVADLSSSTGIPISEFEEALATQRYMENRMRFGSDYREYLLSLGVRSSDARLQLPEYLFGAKNIIQFSEVLQTGVTTSGTPNTGVGNLLGHGLGALKTRPARYFNEEHCIIMSFLSVRPKTIYVNGLDKKHSLNTKFDYWQKEFQHVGAEEVLNKETYWAHSSPNGVFGYADRYDAFRRQENYVSGDFRSSLNYWHYGRIFTGDTALNAAYVSCVPTTRVYQSTTADNMYYQIHHSIQKRALLSRNGQPRLSNV